MQTKPYLYALLTGVVGMGLYSAQIKAIPPTINIDSRLNKPLNETLNIQLLSGGNKSFLAAIQPPALYLGFDPPPDDMKSSLFRRSHYQLVGAFHSLMAPVKSLEELPASIRNSIIYTDDNFLFASLQGNLHNLEFKADRNAIFMEINEDLNKFALINVDNITPKVRTLGDPITLSVWMGWKTSSIPWGDRLGVNKELDGLVQQLLENSQTQPESPVTKIVAVGDIMLARAIGKRISKEINQKGKTDYPFAGTVDVLKKADITIGNLECAISDKGASLPGKDYTFRASPNAVQQLILAGFDILSLGNNHSKDYGSEALIDTLNLLKNAKIATVGAGRNRAEAREFKVITATDGTRVGFLGYTMVLPRNFLAETKIAGVAWTREKGLADDIKNAKASCDVLMVQYHWGTEYTVNPTKAQRILAHKTIDFGADIVIGHHPHWIQEVEFYKDKFIAYSLGNFVFDMTHRPKVTEGMMVTCEIRNKKISQIHCDPVSIKAGQPEIIAWEAVPQKRNRKKIMEEIFVASGLLKSIPDQRLALVQ